MNVDAVELLGARLPLFSRADHRNLIPGIGQRATFLPYASILRHRAVLDEDQHAWRAVVASPSLRCSSHRTRAEQAARYASLRFFDICGQNNEAIASRASFD